MAVFANTCWTTRSLPATIRKRLPRKPLPPPGIEPTDDDTKQGRKPGVEPEGDDDDDDYGGEVLRELGTSGSLSRDSFFATGLCLPSAVVSADVSHETSAFGFLSPDECVEKSSQRAWKKEEAAGSKGKRNESTSKQAGSCSAERFSFAADS